MQRLKALGGLGDDNVHLLFDQNGGCGLEQRCVGKGHVAGNNTDHRRRGRRQPGIESAQGAAARFEVRNEWQVKEGIGRRLIGDDKKFVCYRRKAFDHPLDQGTTEERFEGLVLSHAAGLPAGLDDNAEHRDRL